MAATFQWGEANGSLETVTLDVNNVNWKNIDDTSDSNYSTYPIIAGLSSYQKFQFGYFSGTYSSISNGLFEHTAGFLGLGMTLKGPPSMTADDMKILYFTPTTGVNASLSGDYTDVNPITNGKIVFFGPTSPNANGKASSTTANPAYTNYLVTQLCTLNTVDAGDTEEITLTLRYDEN